MKYFLTIDGRNYDFIRMKYKREATIESKTAEIIVATGRGTTSPKFDDVVIITKEVNNQKFIKWQGKVETVRDLPLPNNTIKIIAYDLKFKVNFNNVKNSGYADTKGSTIFTTEVETPAVTDLTLGTVEILDEVLDTVSLGKSINGSDSKVTRSSAFEIIQVLGDSDIYIERDGTANYLQDAGVDRSASMTLEHGINGALTPDIGYQEDEVRRVKQVIVKGAGVGTNFILGVAGPEDDTEKAIQIELPSVSSNATAALAAQTILNELDKVNKYAKFRLDTDIFQFDYDVYDTVTLKARLPNKTINEELKIFSIETTISSGGDELAEIVTLELQNFERAQLAKMINPIEVSSNSLKAISSTISTTQVDTNVIPSVVAEENSAQFTKAVPDNTPILLETFGPFNNIPSVGTNVIVSMTVTPVAASSGFLELFYTDSQGTYPDPSDAILFLLYDGTNGVTTYLNNTFHIPRNQALETLSLFCKTTGVLNVSGIVYVQRVGA